MSQIEGNNSVLPDMRSSAQEEPKPNIRSDIHHDQDKADINDIIEGLPDDIKEFVKAEVSSLDDMIKALQHLLHPLLGTSLSQADIDTIQALIKQLSASLPQTKEQQASKLNDSAILLADNGKDNDSTSKSLPGANEQISSKLAKSELLLTDTEDPTLLKNTGLTAEQAVIQNKLGVPPSVNENNKALLDSYRNEIKAIQLLAEMGTKVTVNGQTVSLYGAQGVLMTENIVTFMARGDQAFLDNARIAAVDEGYNTLAAQQESDGQNSRGNDDNKQETDSDTLFFYEDE